LQTAPRVPSPHLVYDGRAPGDGAPSGFRPWRNALSRRTAPQPLEARGHQKRRCRSGIMILDAEYPAIAGRSCFRLFSKLLANCRSPSSRIWTARPVSERRNRPKFHITKAKASGPDQTPPRGDRSFGGSYAAGQAFALSCAPLRRCKGEHYDRHSTSGRRARRY